jgi:hypothetical protein
VYAMKKSRSGLFSVSLPVILTAAILASGCAKNSALRHAPPAVEGAAYKETVVLEQVLRVDETENKEIPALLIPVIGAAAKAGLKWLAKQGGQALHDYGAKFGASYSAKVIQADYQRAVGGGSHKYYYVFRRSLEFADSKAAEQVFGSTDLLVPGSHRATEGKYVVDAVSIPIMLETSQDKRSWRFAPPQLQKTNISAKWPYAKAVVFQAHKAKVLQLPWHKEDFKVAIAASTKLAENIDGLIAVRANEPAESLLTLKNIPSSEEWVTSDWQPAPASQNYSLEVTVVESSKMKEWIQKTADSLVKKANSEIDSRVDKALEK